MSTVNDTPHDQYIRALMDISQAITSDLYLGDILKLIAMVTAQVTGFDICSLWLLDKSSDPPTIRLKATQAISPDYVKDRSLGLDEGVVGHVLSTRKPLAIQNVLRNRRFKEKEMAKTLGLISMAGVPLQLKDNQVIGVLNCFTAQPHHFTKTEINLLTTVANQAAVAILNTELLVQTQVIQQELETRKLVEKAKEVLMHRKHMKGDAAYRWLQKQSMNKRKSLRHVAEAVLLSEELNLD